MYSRAPGETPMAKASRPQKPASPLSPSEGGPRWTEAQLRGITTTGHSLLVSAAAGSGKTAMLAARCAHLVCDAAEPCDVDELLVVTFTEAAAAEMKSRIHAALRDRAAAVDSERIRRQVSLVDRASVSTLHSFCARLLREHFHAVGLDPAFTVLDGDEASLLRREVARELFDDRYEFDASGDFHRFVDAYGEGEDGRLIDRVIQTHEMIASLVDPEAWLQRAHDRVADAAENPLETTELGRELIDALARAIDQTRKRCERALELVRGLGGFPKYVAALTEHAQTLRHWDQTLAGEGIDALAEEVSSLELPRLPAVSNATPGKELAKDAVDSVRDAMTKSSWRDLLRFTSAQWQEGLEAVRPHTDVFLSLVRDFEARYRAAKEASRVVDFSDLERMSLRVLSEDASALRPSPAARAYHRRFKHVLVDEYQDINEVQDAILCLLSRECVCDESGHVGNLFCVGDVKQSIYRFRLAEAARFLDRQKLFRTEGDPRRGEVIDLQANFRSRAPLLAAINSVFERLMTEAAVDIEYDQTHRLEAGMKYPSDGGATCFNGSPIEMHLLPAEARTDDDHDAEAADDQELDRSEREAALIAQRIRQLVGLDGSAPACVCEKDPAGGMVSRPIRFGDIVILLRSVRFKSSQYANVLRRAGIPVHAQSGTGYFDSTEIRDMLALLSVLDNQRQDIPLATVLRSPLANLPGPEDCLARVRLAYPLTDEKPVPFHDVVVSYAAEKQDELAARLRDFLTRLGQWRRLAHSRPLAEAISIIFEQSGYLAFSAGLQDGDQRVANLMELHERAASFDTFNRQGLSRFMRMLESLRDGSDLGQPAIASEADNVVRVMSVHRSKGLEFPVVILPDLGKRINVSDCHGSILTDRSAGLGLSVIDEHRMIRYPSLASVLVGQRLRQQALAEELRVLYVAMTRAKEHLILVGTCKADAPDGWTSRWANHAGAFPRDLILDASTLLHWIGPTAAAAGEDVIRIQRHTAEEVATWDSDHAKRQALSPQQERLAALEPLDPAPGLDPLAAEVVARLKFKYPFASFVKLAAAEAVTAHGNHAVGMLKADDSRLPRILPRPRFLAAEAASPSDVGTATHLVLMHLDFARPCDAADLSAQFGKMIERKLITTPQADAVDRQALLWLIGTEVGKLLRANAARLRREASIHFAASSELAGSDDPLDRVMIRGRIDVLVPEERGCTLIDYKTDAIDKERVSFRANDYAPQLNSYRQAIEQITGRPVQKCYLVFLTPRMIIAV
jgi:ATP-dependent helicase/nuclease subunit A